MIRCVHSFVQITIAQFPDMTRFRLRDTFTGFMMYCHTLNILNLKGFVCGRGGSTATKPPVFITGVHRKQYLSGVLAAYFLTCLV